MIFCAFKVKSVLTIKQNMWIEKLGKITFKVENLRKGEKNIQLKIREQSNVNFKIGFN